MTSRHTALILLSGWLLATGCTWLPPRGEHGARVELRPEQLDLRQSDPHAPPIPSGVGPAGHQVAESASPVSSAPVQGGGQSVASPALSRQPMAQSDSQNMVPADEMTAFIHELDAASHIDAVERRQILTAASQAPAEWRLQVIRQYRALLAQDQTATTAAVGATAEATTQSVAVPLPQDLAAQAQADAVRVATHSEPVVPLEAKAKPDLETLLEAFSREMLSREMKNTKGEAAAYSNVSDQPGDRSGAERETNDGPISKNATWKQLVDSAIEKLEAQKERRLDSDVREEDEARLRMLYLIADRRDDAVKAITSLEPEMQEFWSKQFFGLSTMLDSELIADRSNRMIESKRNFDEAIRRLGESSPLFVRNLVFVTKVNSYGAYTPFDDNDFQPGEAVLLYAEVENYRCKETARGYHTNLRSSYEIFDSGRQKVAEHEFSTNEEYCKNARRDFFTVCEFRMPEKLDPGKYVLRLTVADLNGEKAGESSITFHIRNEF